jgi:hypothetical protein
MLSNNIKQIINKYRADKIFISLMEDDSKFFVFPNIPLNKASSAIQSYAKYISIDDIIILIDDTLFGSATDGLILTAENIFFHELASDGQVFPLDKINQIFFNENKLFINMNKVMTLTMPKKSSLLYFINIVEDILGILPPTSSTIENVNTGQPTYPTPTAIPPTPMPPFQLAQPWPQPTSPLQMAQPWQQLQPASPPPQMAQPWPQPQPASPPPQMAQPWPQPQPASPPPHMAQPWPQPQPASPPPHPRPSPQPQSSSTPTGKVSLVKKDLSATTSAIGQSAPVASLTEKVSLVKKDLNPRPAEQPQTAQSDPAGPRPPLEAGPVVQIDYDQLCADLFRMNQSSNIYVRPYFDQKKLYNAINSYALDIPPNDIILMVDDTTFGSGKDGALVTMGLLRTKKIFSDPITYQLPYLTNFSCYRDILLSNNLTITTFKYLKEYEIFSFINMLILIQQAYFKYAYY